MLVDVNGANIRRDLTFGFTHSEQGLIKGFLGVTYADYELMLYGSI
jgi:hypothetical protein